MKLISFNYNSDDSCFFDSDKSHWGCCCACEHNKKVMNHCCNDMKKSRDEGCICNEFLDFYICKVEAEDDTSSEVHLNGEHGCCELYSPRESSLSKEEKEKVKKLLFYDFEKLGFSQDMREKILKISMYNLSIAEKIMKGYPK